eukprot:IDg19818t1
MAANLRSECETSMAQTKPFCIDACREINVMLERGWKFELEAIQPSVPAVGVNSNPLLDYVAVVISLRLKSADPSLAEVAKPDKLANCSTSQETPLGALPVDLMPYGYPIQNEHHESKRFRLLFARTTNMSRVRLQLTILRKNDELKANGAGRRKLHIDAVENRAPGNCIGRESDVETKGNNSRCMVHVEFIRIDIRHMMSVCCLHWYILSRQIDAL